MNKRLQKMITNNLIPNRGGVFIDAYNQTINTEIAGTITTRVDASNMVYITEIIPSTPTNMGMANFLKHQNDGFKATCIMDTTIQDRVYDYDDVIAEPRAATQHQCSSGLNNREPKVLILPLLIPEATTKGYAEAYDGDSVNLALPNSKTRRGRVGHQIANTLDTSCNQGVVTNYRIRKLTPRECFRLMDVSESDIDKLLNTGLSNTQLYKLAGNSIVCSVIYHVLRKLLIEKENENQQLTLF